MANYSGTIAMSTMLQVPSINWSRSRRNVNGFKQWRGPGYVTRRRLLINEQNSLQFLCFHTSTRSELSKIFAKNQCQIVAMNNTQLSALAVIQLIANNCYSFVLFCTPLRQCAMSCTLRSVLVFSFYDVTINGGNFFLLVYLYTDRLFKIK